MALTSAPLRCRGLLTLLGAVFVLYGIVLLAGPVMQERALVSRLAELEARLQHLDALHRARREEVAVLASQLGSLLVGANAAANVSGSPASNIFFGIPPLELNPEARLLLLNITGQEVGRSVPSLRLPSVYHFLPHLLHSPSSLRPAYCLSRGRSGVSVVLGIPTVKREAQSYLMTTLQNLVDCITPEEAPDTLIVVFVAETDQEYVLQVSKQLEGQFAEQVESGLIEVVSPPAAYYPPMQSLRSTFDDPPKRVQWRSKQNLDFAFLMMYAQPKGSFYVQLEDDILAKKNFISTMKNYALQQISKNSPWFVLEFCQLGFIGKMFRCVELPWLIQFFLMFYNVKPVDWLLDDLISNKICNLNKKHKHYKKAKAKLRLKYKPSLFQHIGMQSSLQGKEQNIKDKQFGEVTLFFPHQNPEAKIASAIKHHKRYSLRNAYLGETFFWGLYPQSGDHLVFDFTEPTPLNRYLFRSGNVEYPSDIFYNTSVEILPSSSQINYSKKEFNTTADGYIIVGQFNMMGIAEGTIDPKFGPIKVLRLNVHSDSENWAILSEIHIVPENDSYSKAAAVLQRHLFNISRPAAVDQQRN